MRRIIELSLCLALAGWIGTNVSAAPDHPELKAFPEAEEGQQRIVIVLPEKTRDEEGAFKVELIPGKVMMTDGVNKVRHGSTVESRPLKGWGYTFYEVIGKDVVMSTKMAPRPGTKKVEKFVAGQSLTIRYNSRLPVVVYAPEGYEVRYRIWSAGEEQVAGE
tara:strand:- start:1522 stop:2007 length:486 start_codon:yes stop_codon:yes gene_type:complete